MKKKLYIITIIGTYLAGFALLAVIVYGVYGGLPKMNPNYSSAKEAFVWSKKQLEEKYPDSHFYIWQIKAGRTDVYNDSTIDIGRADKWLVTFIKYNPGKKPLMEMLTATMDRSKLTGEGLFDAKNSEKLSKLLPELKSSNDKFLNWKYDSNTLYYQNLFLAKERRYRILRAIKIDFSRSEPLTTLSFARPMTSIEKKAFSMQDHFMLELEISYDGKIKSIKEMPIKI